MESAIGLVAPFSIYLLAEEIHGSGVLAVVVAALLIGQRSVRAGYATRLLERPDVLSRGSPALRVAWAVRLAKGCDEVRELLPQATRSGDDRVATLLRTIARCRTSEPCCPEDEQAITDYRLHCWAGLGSNDELRRHVAWVGQEAFLFHGSVHENIALGTPTATREAVIAAAQAAELHEFIQTLPSGYDTLVGDFGSTLSGGQRQRLSIARAVRPAPSTEKKLPPTATGLP